MVLSIKRALLPSLLLLLLICSLSPSTVHGQRKRRQRPSDEDNEPSERHMTNQQEVEDVQEMERKAEEMER